MKETKYLVLNKNLIRTVLDAGEIDTLDFIVDKLKEFEGPKSYRVFEEKAVPLDE